MERAGYGSSVEMTFPYVGSSIVTNPSNDLQEAQVFQPVLLTFFLKGRERMAAGHNVYSYGECHSIRDRTF